VFGLQGWVRLFSYTEPREAILDHRHCLLKRDGEWTALDWQDGKRHGKQVIAHIRGVDDRDLAEALVGADIGIRRAQLPAIGDGQYYWSDLENLDVVSESGRRLGKVSHLLSTGANDVLVVMGEKEILIPFVTGLYIKDVDLQEGVIRVDWEWD
jgi:16S rRNA processing protein RimM